MFNKVRIQVTDDNSAKCLVQAISIKKNKADLLIPSPFGTETMLCDSLDEAMNLIKQCGYNYYVVNSEDTISGDISAEKGTVDYSKIVEVFIKNLGHENLEIRNSAINSLSKFGIEIAPRLINILQSDVSWLVQQSTIKCIENVIATEPSAAAIFMDPLIEISDTTNTMVKSAALKALERICDIKDK